MVTYHRVLRKLINEHRMDRGSSARLVMLDDRARRNTLSPRNTRERAARREDQIRYRKSVRYHLCIGLTRLRLWEVVWLFCDRPTKESWRSIVAKF